MNRSDAEKLLRVISRAWGRQRGYAFFPWIDREAQRRTGKRRDGYHEGPGRPKNHPKREAFKWPEDREEILDHMAQHENHDLYWCPSLFEYPTRRSDLAMDEHALWADLDEVDPRTLDDYPPTIAWESSPGRYQALWVAASGDFMGASWPGNENQRLTYYIGADQSGWDTTQLLRVPEWHNHKPEYGDDHPQGKLLWSNGRTYLSGDFSELPEVDAHTPGELTEALEQEVDSVDRHKVIARVRLKLNHKARELLSAREASGDVSSQLWYLIRCLADAGCTVAEIVSVVRESVWNKFAGRADEMRRLITEASKAIAQRSEEIVEELEHEAERPDPTRLAGLLANVKRPKYLVQGVLTHGACGFIAGEPKSFKSWTGLDLALSVSSGQDFLNHFPVVEPGPVLYIQEEDPLPMIKDRSAKIWSGKTMDRLTVVHDLEVPEIMWLPPEAERDFDPDVNAYVQNGVTISDPAWQVWLDEQLEQGMGGVRYRLLVMDTLMMMAGEVDENRSQEMTTKVFKPLKVLSRKHDIAIVVVHHLGKGDKPRSGSRMLGSVANHAWSEDSMYFLHTPGGDLKMEIESKSIPGQTYRVSGIRNQGWDPNVSLWSKPDETEDRATKPSRPRRERKERDKGPGEATQKIVNALEESAVPMTISQVAEAIGTSYQQALRNLRRAKDRGLVQRLDDNTWRNA